MCKKTVVIMVLVVAGLLLPAAAAAVENGVCLAGKAVKARQCERR